MINETEFFAFIGKMFRKDPSVLNRETLLREDLGATSQMLFGVSALLEKQSGKKIAFSDINNCRTLGDAIALAEN